MGMKLFKDSRLRVAGSKRIWREVSRGGLHQRRQDEHAGDGFSLATTEPLSTDRAATPGTPSIFDGGSSGGSAAAVAARMVPARARERRRWLDPHSGFGMRPRRLEAVPRGRKSLARPDVRRKPGTGLRSKASSRSRCAIRRRYPGCRSRVRCPADPYFAAAAVRALPTRLGS